MAALFICSVAQSLLREDRSFRRLSGELPEGLGQVLSVVEKEHPRDRFCIRNATSGVSALTALQSRQARTRLSARSYAVCPRRGRTWSRVMTSGEVSVPQ